MLNPIRITVPWAVIGLVVVAFLAGALSFSLLHDQATSNWGNLLLNLSSEFIGIALGSLVTVLVASSLAQKKLDSVAPTLVRLIAQLRRNKIINGEVASSPWQKGRFPEVQVH